MENQGFIVYCTFSTTEEAKKIASVLVTKKLAACCSVIPKITSYYVWDSQLEESEEVLMIIKTQKKNYDQLEKEIKMLHSYSVPEIVGFKIEKGSNAYMDWLFESTSIGISNE